MDLKEQLIDKCCQLFSQNILTQEPSDFFGTPPQKLIIEYGAPAEKTRLFCVKTVLERYEFSKDGLKAIPTEDEPDRGPTSGMYYHVAEASIGFKDEKAFLNLVVGPRFGRGYEMEILEENGEKRLGELKVLWIS